MGLALTSSRRRQNLGRLLAVGVLATLTLSCSSEAGEQEEASIPALQIRMLLGQATLDEVQQLREVLAAEQETLIADCMNSEGFDYVAARPEAIALPVVDMSVRGNVEEFGFRISTVDYANLQPAVSNPNEAIFAELSASEAQAWTDQRSACEVSAQEALATRYDFDTIGSVVEEVNRRVDTGLAVLRARDEWTECMFREGYDFATEDDLIASLRNEFSLIDGSSRGQIEEFKMREIQVALTSFDCRRTLDREINLARERAMREIESPFADVAFPD